MKGQDVIIPTGSAFLPNTGTAYLKRIHKTEEDPKARLLAYIMRKQGTSMRQIGSTLNMSYSTVRGWLLRAVQMGIMGRYDERRPGATPKLDAHQIKQLKAYLVAGPDRYSSRKSYASM